MFWFYREVQFDKERAVRMAENIFDEQHVDLNYDVFPFVKYYETHHIKEIGLHVHWMGGRRTLIFVREKYFPDARYGHERYVYFVGDKESDRIQARMLAEFFGSVIMEFIIRTRFMGIVGRATVHQEVEVLTLLGAHPSRLLQYEN